MSHKLLSLRIVTPEKELYSKEVTYVTLPTEDGEITVYANHTPMVGLLKPGEVTVAREDEFKEWFAVSTGIVEIKPTNEVVVMADTSEHASEIDIEKAIEARKKAQKAIEEGPKEGISVGEFEKIVDWEMARIRTHEKHHDHFQIDRS